VIEEANAAVPHPNAMMVDSHDTAVTTETAMLCPWRHDLATRFAPSELTNLRHLPGVVLYLLLL